MFQTEDHDSMMSWIAAIQTNNNPDEDVSVFFVTNGTRTDHVFSTGFTWPYKVVGFQNPLAVQSEVPALGYLFHYCVC